MIRSNEESLDRAFSALSLDSLPLKRERESLIKQKNELLKYHENVENMCKDISKRAQKALRPDGNGKKKNRVGNGEGGIKEIFRERDESLMMVQKRQSQVTDLFTAHKTLHGKCPVPCKLDSKYEKRIRDETRKLMENEKKNRTALEKISKSINKTKNRISEICEKEVHQSKVVADLEKQLAKARNELKETKYFRLSFETELQTKTKTLRKTEMETKANQKRLRDKISVLQKLNNANTNLGKIRDKLVRSARDRASSFLHKQYDPSEIDSRLFDVSRRLVSECLLYFQLQEKCHSFLLNRIVDSYTRRKHIEGEIKMLSSLGSAFMGTNLDDLRRRVKSLTIAENDDRDVLITLASQTASIRDSLNGLWSDDEAEKEKDVDEMQTIHNQLRRVVKRLEPLIYRNHDELERIVMMGSKERVALSSSSLNSPGASSGGEDSKRRNSRSRSFERVSSSSPSKSKKNSTVYRKNEEKSTELKSKQQQQSQKRNKKKKSQDVKNNNKNSTVALKKDDRSGGVKDKKKINNNNNNNRKKTNSTKKETKRNGNGGIHSKKSSNSSRTVLVSTPPSSSSSSSPKKNKKKGSSKKRNSKKKSSEIKQQQ